MDEHTRREARAAQQADLAARMELVACAQYYLAWVRGLRVTYNCPEEER